MDPENPTLPLLGNHLESLGSRRKHREPQNKLQGLRQNRIKEFKKPLDELIHFREHKCFTSYLSPFIRTRDTMSFEKKKSILILLFTSQTETS